MRKVFSKKLKEKYKPDIKYIFKTFKSDWREVFKSKSLIILFIGLLIIPSLYAWFNIEAFWDPYGNTKNLKVAVINDDEGYNFKNQDFNFGEKIVDNLKENNQLDWQFTSRKKSYHGLETGEYYAIIEIPKDFSKDMLSLVKKDIHKAKINYTINEKTNAVASKVTDQGANSLQKKIEETLVKTVGEISISTLGGISNGVGDIDQKLDKLSNSIKGLDKQLENAEKLTSLGKESVKNANFNINNDSLKNFDKTIEDTKKLSDEIKTAFDSARSSASEISPSIKSDLESTLGVIEQIRDLSNSLSQNLNTSSDYLITNLTRIRTKVDTAKNITESVVTLLERINIFRGRILTKSISDLNGFLSSLNSFSAQIDNAISSVNNGSALSDTVVSSLNSSVDGLRRRLNNIYLGFDNNIKDPIDSVFLSKNVVSDDLYKALNNAQNITPKINELSSKLKNTQSNVNSAFNIASISIGIMREQLKNLQNSINDIKNNSNFKNFNEIIKSNISDRTDFLINPVVIDSKKIHPIKNYGTAMTPFYSVLACWVGSLILISILSIEKKNDRKPIDNYLCKLLFFISISIGQSIIIGVGDLVLLGVVVKHPIAFILLLMLTSLTFCTIIYSLVSVFGTAGKAISIFLLVIQIGGSGGTFPVQMTPTFFRTINTYIPFTYAIGASREAVGGIFPQNLIKDVRALLIYFVLALVFAIVFKEKINRLFAKFNEAIHKSSLVE